MLERILRARDAEEFCSSFFSVVGVGEARLRAVFWEGCRHASEVYPDIYAAPYYFVPHAYMGLVAAWQVKDYLKETNRWRPLLQTLWYLATETREWCAHAVGAAEGTMVRGGEVESCLAEALVGGDFDVLFSLYADCQHNPALARSATRVVLSAVLKDGEVQQAADRIRVRRLESSLSHHQ